MNDVETDAKAIFLDALDCSGPKERECFLEQACGSDATLRTRVDELLRAHRDAGAFLRGVECQDATRDRPMTEGPGTVIGPYKLLERIGEGGMGLVFMAEQRHPVRRKVALKILKPGMGTRQVVARFEAERQALALMDHANIAKIFDAGTVGDSEPRPSGRGESPPLPHGCGSERLCDLGTGRPYFVMELVRGVPITEFYDQHRFTTRQRLELFVTVCRAVQHAHQKGIIHRDLKPSNVLVTLHDTVAVPKVIDFGIAMATGQVLTEWTLFTQFAQMVGTPLYMSPEQAQMNGLDVDTRSDVYSLGVLRYELLTGSTPFVGETLKQVGLDEMRRMIREDEPPLPSRRLSTLDAQACSTVAERRGVNGRRLGQLLRGEVDWIVMKALEKDRNRRYESASALAADVGRYLHDEPVAACPPSAGQWDASAQLFEPLLDKQRRLCGSTHSSTIFTVHRLATCYDQMGRLTESIALHEQLLELIHSTHSLDRGALAWPLTTFAKTCQQARDFDRADRLFREALEHCRKRADS